jgi:hypothetical protein
MKNDNLERLSISQRHFLDLVEKFENSEFGIVPNIEWFANEFAISNQAAGSIKRNLQKLGYLQKTHKVKLSRCKTWKGLIK